MVRSSGQHRCGLIFCGVMMIILGSGITVAGFINDFLDPYDELSKPELFTYSTHLQYWVGIPLFLLGIYVIATACCKVSCLMVLGLVTVSLVLLLSIFGVILEGPMWRSTLRAGIIVNENDCDDVDGICRCSNGGFVSDLLKCDELKKLTVIYTVMVAFSAIATLVCLFAAFIYFRILGWMLHISYDDPIDDYYAKAVNSHFINGHHGRGQTNDVALGSYPQ